MPEGRGREVEQQIWLQSLQIRHRVAAEQPLFMQLLFHPQVFAEGEAEPPTAAAALQLQQTGLIGGAEVTPLIKDVVAGQ